MSYVVTHAEDGRPLCDEPDRTAAGGVKVPGCRKLATRRGTFSGHPNVADWHGNYCDDHAPPIGYYHTKQEWVPLPEVRVE